MNVPGVVNAARIKPGVKRDVIAQVARAADGQRAAVNCYGTGKGAEPAYMAQRAWTILSQCARPGNNARQGLCHRAIVDVSAPPELAMLPWIIATGQIARAADGK